MAFLVCGQVHVLNQQRSRRTEITSEGFVDLAVGMGAVLDKCRQSKDVHTAKMAMMLSQVSKTKERAAKRTTHAPKSRRIWSSKNWRAGENTEKKQIDLQVLTLK